MTEALLSSPTEILFPSGPLFSDAEILWSALQDNKEEPNLYLVTTRTPFHPVSYNWPDQPCDIGFLSTERNEYEIVSAHVAAYNLSNGTLLHDSNITVRQDDPDWVFHVVHEVSLNTSVPPDDLSAGKLVTLKVDPNHRAKLARTHTSCHLMALALNKAVASLWSKEAKLDSLGNPDFDQLAIQESRMNELEARDTYRLGKSLRKRGFNTEAFINSLDEITSTVASQVNEWIDSGFEVVMESDSTLLNSRRYWKATLSGLEATIPCGGVHVTRSDSLANVRVEAENSTDQPEVVFRTVPIT
jgi:alanyl-tRNA synthetase